jgi:hypothetical protein
MAQSTRETIRSCAVAVACAHRECKAATVWRVPCRRTWRGPTPCRSAAWAMVARRTWSTNRGPHISCRTSAGVVHRSPALCLVGLRARRSSAAYHRARESPATSSLVHTAASRTVGATRTTRVRHPRGGTRTRHARLALVAGHALEGASSSQAGRVGVAQETPCSARPHR